MANIPRTHSVVLATLETRSFTFEGVGRSKRGALQALRWGIDRHLQQYRTADRAYFDALQGDVYYRTLTVSDAYRDRERISDE